MPDVRAFQSVVEAAERAAAAGDLASAEALLREAAGLQEAEFGPLHPDLASTFNNLAVLCEMAERPVEAEQFYRRAYAIATATLDPEHALVATSRDNLRDFCEARGLPLDDGAAAPVAASVSVPVTVPVTTPVAAPVTTPVAAPVTTPVATSVSAPVAAPAFAPPRRSIRRAAMWAALILVLLTAVAGLRLWSKPAPALTRTSAPPEVAPSAPPARPPQAAPPPEPVSPPAVTPQPEVPPPTAAASPDPAPAPAAATPAGVRVVVATVCQTLTTGGAWRCTPAGDPSAPGPRAFYTRIASPRPVRVRHLWYHEDRLRQSVALRVGANDRDGYRTFSRQTVGPGEWRVELRAENGALLDQARFVVR